MRPSVLHPRDSGNGTTSAGERAERSSELRLYRSPAVLLQITGERLKGVKEPHHHAHREEHSM